MFKTKNHKFVMNKFHSKATNLQKVDTTNLFVGAKLFILQRGSVFCVFTLTLNFILTKKVNYVMPSTNVSLPQIDNFIFFRTGPKQIK
jgi:hypothetical protein